MKNRSIFRWFTKMGLRSTWPWAFMGMCLLSLFATGAYAQSLVTIDQINGATQAEDLSMQVLVSTIGDFFAHPLASIGSPGGSSTLTGTMFLVFNSAIFVICALGGTYAVVSGIVSTAHEGEVLGRRLSAVWLPIRMVTGIAGVVPVFGGFNLAQVVMVVNAGLGIGLANLMLAWAINATASYQSLLSPGISYNVSGAKFDQAVNGLFVMHVCKLAVQEHEAEMAVNASMPSADPIGVNSATPGVIAIGTSRDPNLCGRVQIHWTGQTTRDASAIFSFRTASVNYDAIANRVKTAYLGQLPSISDKAAQLANEWYDARRDARQSGAAVPPLPTAKLDALVGEFSKSVQTEFSGTNAEAKAQEGAINSAVAEQMKRDGWFGLGSWSSTFMEVNAAIASAFKSIQIDVMPIQESAVRVTAVHEAMDQLNKSAEQAAVADVGPQSDSMFCQLVLRMGLNVTAPTGNCSLGQSLVKLVIDATAVGSGGGDLINPVIMMKNFGDMTLSLAEGMWALKSTLDNIGLGDAGGIAGGMASTSTNAECALDGCVSGLSVAGMLKQVTSWAAGKVFAVAKAGGLGILQQLAAALPVLVGLMFSLGAMMSIYIPMVPFITWFGAITAYCIIVFEGLAAGPIAALAHIEADGEGMGQRTERAYIFQLNLIARPSLMVIAFFASNALVIALGTILAKMFLPAIASAQGNSVTGLVSILGYLFLFGVMNWTLIQAVFNMAYVLPDQVLGMIGAGHSEQLGRDVEGKLNGFFLAAGRIGQNSVSQVFGGRGRLGGGSNKPGVPEGQNGVTPGASAGSSKNHGD